jgi:hypothetical protein
MDIHKNARLTLRRREELVQHVHAQKTLKWAAARFSVTAKTAAKWVHRYRALGATGLLDRSQKASAQIICASYGQDLASKHSLDCRTLMASAWYKSLFPTRLASQKQSVQEFLTTRNGFRLATSEQKSTRGS